MSEKTLIEVGWKKLVCGHIVRLPYGGQPCPTCAEVKAARDEVLELVEDKVFEYEGVDDETSALILEMVGQAYRDRFGG